MHDGLMTTTTGTRDQKLAAALERIDTGVAEIKTSADWTRWMKACATFHDYSFNNVMLILSQRPDATRCAGYNAWKSLKRHVRKGEHGIVILAPSVVKTTAEEQAQTGRTEKLVGFHTTVTFDVSQTDGEPLPEAPAVTLLEGEAPVGLIDALIKLIEGSGFSVSYVENLGGPNGMTVFGPAHKVFVLSGLSDAQKCKTLAHELGHIRLHDPDKNDHVLFDCRGQYEVEAESVAYVVTSHHGLDSSGYSFAYVAGWSDKDPEAVKRSATRVIAATRKILAVTDPES
jgi:antirestriction protein ArdC